MSCNKVSGYLGKDLKDDICWTPHSETAVSQLNEVMAQVCEQGGLEDIIKLDQNTVLHSN